MSLGTGRLSGSTNGRQAIENTIIVTPTPKSSVCLWLPKAQILVAKRINATSQLIEWLDEHGEAGLEFSTATEELVTSIKQVQPHQRQFVNDWVKLGPHVDAKQAWENELSSIQLRIQAFDDLIEGYESSNIDKYSHGLTTWRESAQIGNEANSAMLEIFTRCTASQMGLSPTPTARAIAISTPMPQPSPTPTSILRPQPSPTPTSTFSIPSLLMFGQTAWVYYKDQDTRFSAYYPGNWERTVIPPKPDDPGRAVVFVAPPESAGAEGNTMISPPLLF